MDNYGLRTRKSGDLYTIAYNGVELGITINPKNELGIYVDGSRLKVYGNDIAISGTESTTLRQEGEDMYFGDALLATNGTCINITKEDYNILLAGELVEGYSKYQRNSIYNIVADVESAPVVTYSVNDGVVRFSTNAEMKSAENMLYNDAGVLEDNTEDPTETVDETDCPFFCVKWFKPVIPVGGSIEVTYLVDTMDMEMLNYDKKDRTFTIVVETEDGSVVKKTTYGGMFSITTPAFENGGETWFSIRCIDNRGVSSAVQYYDILVREQVTYSTYNMVEADLDEFTYDGETYRIVPDDSTVATALANKAALSAFFAKVKANGYNRVVMLKRTYWIDYHQTSMASMWGGNNIVFPDEFTVDLNGSTIRVTQSNDLKGGEAIYLKRNFDTHIVNGALKGNYDGFDFATTKANTGGGTVVPGETLSVVGCSASRYCSFENLDISNSVGYDGSFGGVYASTYQTPSFSVGGIDVLTGEVDGTKTGMVVSGLISIKSEWFAIGEIAICKFGYGGYWAGEKREYFMSFYDQSDTHIKTVKSKMYYGVKIPENAKKLRVAGYGTVDEWKYSVSGAVVAIHERSKNILISNCYWHDTRSCCISSTQVKGLRFENCRFSAIAKEEGLYSVTRLLGDLEDGRQWTCDTSMVDCVYEGSEGSNNIKVIYSTNLTFEGNRNIRFWANGGLESGFVCNNEFPAVEINRTYLSFHPDVLYKNNEIVTLTVTDNLPVVEPLTMIDTNIKNFCSFSKLHLKNSRNGGYYFN